MFDQLSGRLLDTLKLVRGQARLSEKNIQEALRDVRVALLEADVALPVVKQFIEQVRQRAVGVEVTESLNPGQMMVKVVHDQLSELMGGSNAGLDLTVRPPAVVMLAGLQGAGKTTTAAKLALWLKVRAKKRVLLVSADVYRPAAIDQLRTLAADLEVQFLESTPEQQPVEIARTAVDHARTQAFDVLIVDTAGRLHVDEEMMAEIRAVHAAVQPVETLFVVDSMTGQDAVNSAAAFDAALPLTGVILTKTDGDARGGAALSVRQITGKPVKFMGTGEKPDAFEAFHPERIASRLLGMGDVLSLVEQAEQKVSKAKAAQIATKLAKGKGFDLEDFRDQMLEMEKMGGLTSLIDKLPGMSGVPNQVLNQVDDRQMRRTVAIINSMTPRERNHPTIIRGSRKRRIAAGSGTQVQEVNRLLKQFTQMQKMMKRMRKKGGMARILKGLGGRLPPPA
ncbi:MAG: signal recognition particle protein [Gammaproteobacteria bacterium]|nr:signal recognition particle protein [Gammaproteobacteria bacterium]